MSAQAQKLALHPQQLALRVPLASPLRPVPQLHIVPSLARRTAVRDEFARDLTMLRPDLYARALRLTRDPSRAEDLAQDAIERALRCRAQFQPGTSLRAWTQTIVFSLFISDYRRRRREVRAQRALGVDPCAWTSLDPTTVEATTQNLTPRLQRAVDSLGAPFRQVLVLVDLEERSYRDAADTLGVPIGTVMSRLHRARKQLSAMVVDIEAPLAA